ncbi:putative kinesin [Leptomonas pyrrhocoris]|uniref:Putative kinesin n=1 Tax=Leptomonas pyrrhocoris TaxID=157538 RepID=A0A0M9G5G6_LEPPY|nr:putative kinesin [Leptomonas pyrrhocoris]XP_015661141.1 putative kinesin [Leptomonas pyrrhocoris]XP_015661142.1 putative kinesin [Leptomonas pyrrhocoris]KPA82701.1 putative kinesin [Leptomonas pyrrhocoris]KPA82702.1 putative kinesin [Leptomonas pyrrhocoris]KPA82703.1 putative kinesin [Leptomonas pyrrhocoris]|eukprot:XP_015661140.1 putative kinesin [Leptomonas pyrrhocoris]
MLPLSTQESAEADNASMSSSTPTTAHAPPPSRKGSLDNETSATKVFVRVRPFSAAERRQSGSGDPPAIVTVSDENPCHITTLDPSKQYTPKSTYVFDRCFNSAAAKPAAGDDAQLLLPGDGTDGSAVVLSTLEDVAAEALLNPLQLDCLSHDQAAVYGYVGRPVLMNALAGYNGCVFAYGQTGSGKTYTMMGPPGTFGAVVTSATPASLSAAISNVAQVSGGTSAASPTSKKFRRAATGYAGSQRTAPDTTIVTSGIDDAGDARFQSYASMVPRMSATAQRTPRVTDVSSPLGSDVTPRGDKTPKGGAVGEGAKGTTGMEGDERLRGILPRLVRDLFDELHLKRERDSSHSFRVEVEYYEIYREKVMDLLSSHSVSANIELRVRQSKTNGPYVENLKKKHVEDARQVFRLLRQGNLRRHTASTAMNDRSSRSHAIFVLHLVQMRIADQDSSSSKVTSKVNLVDLAGSERTGAHNAEGDQFKEGVVINISLTVLGRVVDALADKSQGKRNVFCPYRDSVLTWLLMDSLGGNSKTTMVATVSPHCTNFEEACQTLRYASRAKQIVTKVVVNEDPQVRQIKALTAEVQRLKALLVAEGKAPDNDEDVEALQDRIHSLEQELSDTRAELDEKAVELSSLQALRRVTSTLPSTLKAGNAGAAGAAKELSKAKSDVRRLEAENLLHLQTEEELHRTMVRVKAVESKNTQLLADLKESQESTKKLEKERQDRDKRIIELQQQLFQERAKAEESSMTASSPLLSPCGGSGHVGGGATYGVAAASLSSSEKHAAHKAAVGKKVSKKLKGGATALDATAASADSAEAAWVAAKARLCAQFNEEKKMLNLQVQERSDAFRKSQLDVKKLKEELKGAQDTLQTLEKQLNDHHADAMRRLQEEMQVLRRTLKDERKGNKDVRQWMNGPVEERPTFSFTSISDVLMAHERTGRSAVVADEKAARTSVEQAVQFSKEEAEREMRMKTAYAAQLADLQSTADGQAKALADLLARHGELQAAHAMLKEVADEHVAASARLKAQLEGMAASNNEAAETYRQEIAKLQEQVDAVRKLAAEQQEIAAAQLRQERSIRNEVTVLSEQLQREKEGFVAAAVEHARQLTDKDSALAAAASAVTTLETAHAQQLEEQKAEHAAQVSGLEAKERQLVDQLSRVLVELHHEKETHKAETQHSIEQAKQQEEALAALQVELDDAMKSSARADEATANAAALQQHVDELLRTLDAHTASSDDTARHLTAQLTAARADCSKAEEARQDLLERAREQAAAYAEQLQAMREEVAAERAAKASAGEESAVAMQRVTTQLLSQQQQGEEMRASLSDQIAELEAQRTTLEETLQCVKRRGAEESAAHAAELEALRQELEEERAAHDVLTTAHAEEMRMLREEGARNERAAQANAEKLTEQLHAHAAALETANTQHAQSSAEFAQKLEVSRTELQRSEVARRHQIERALEQAGEHTKAMEEVRAQLTTAQVDAAADAAVHEQRVRDVESRLSAQQTEAAKATAELQRQLEEVQAFLRQAQSSSSQTIASLEAQLDGLHEALQKSEEARKTHVQRSVEQASAHAQREKELTDKLAAAAAYQETHAKEVAALQQEYQTKEGDLTAQVNALHGKLRAHEELTRTQLKEKESELATVKDELKHTQDDLAKSEQARRTAVQSSLAEANEHSETLAVVQRQLQREREEAADAAATFTKQLQDAEHRLEQTTAAADATAAALHKELDIQRQTAAAQAVEHAQSTSALEAQLAAAQTAAQNIAKAREREQERVASESAAHATVMKALQAQLAEADRVRAASDTAHEAIVHRMKSDMAKEADKAAAAVAKLQEELRDLQAQLELSTQAREAQAEEAMKQAEAHSKSLQAMQDMFESSHKKQVAAVKKSYADHLASLEAQLAYQTTSARSLRDDLQDTRNQMKHMVETQDYLRMHLENEKQTTTELRLRQESTERARAASAAEAAQLQKDLTKTTTFAAQLTQEVAKLSRELQEAREVSSSTQQQLATQESVAVEQEQRIGQQTAQLESAQATIDGLRGEINELQTQKAELQKAQEALMERQREQLVTQQVDTVTELEAQFRAMEKERRALEHNARQTEEALRATIDKQSKELRQMREDLDFNVSMNQFESSGGGGALGQGAGVGGTGGSGVPPLPGGAAVANKTVSNGSFASRSASPAVGSTAAGGVTGMLSSFFRRTATGAAPLPTTVGAGAPHGPSQAVRRHSSVLHARSGGGGEPRPGATTPVRRGSNLYTTASFRPPSTPLFFAKVEASGSRASAGLFSRTASKASVGFNLGDSESTSWQGPSASHAPSSLLPAE